MSRDSIGRVLKQEREDRSLSLQELSSTTRIPRKTLECLEEDRFEDLPSGVFVRGRRIVQTSRFGASKVAIDGYGLLRRHVV